jgi:ubiquitin C
METTTILAQQQRMRIQVKLFGKPMVFDVDSSETIRDLKHRIMQKENISIRVQRLIYCRRPLDDESRTINEYRIAPDSTIYLMLRLHVA